jgi:hypothetical protein
MITNDVLNINRFAAMSILGKIWKTTTDHIHGDKQQIL